MQSPKGAFQKQDDTRFWKPEVDKTGTASAVIRFLPAKSGEEFPFVQLHSHGFQGPTGKWFIDQCPTSIGEQCPACEGNKALYNIGDEGSKKLASSRKRRLSYISNILVVNDPKHPEYNGQVFLFKYGKKIFEKATDMINPPPEFADMEPLNPFDPEYGANFKLRVAKVDGFPNYDRSSFDNESAIGNEDKISGVLDKMYSLNDLLDPKLFKSYDQLKKRFDMVVGNETEEHQNTKPALEDEPAPPAPKAKAAAKTSTPKATKKVVEESSDQGDDFFAELARQTDES
jgi:hypothetical protein